MKAKYTLALPALLLAIAIGGCERPHSKEAAKAEKQSDPPPVAQSAELKAAQAAGRLTGVANILSPDALLQIDADLKAATITSEFSKGTAGRYESATSLSRQTVENAKRQAGTDATQRKLLETRLRQTWGEDAPFLDTARREKLIAGLSAGTVALVRLDFPDVTSGQPHNVRVAPLSGGDDTPVKTMWIAPSGNQSMPGVSYFGLIDAGPGLRPGDRARLTAEGSETSSGVVVPSSAIVIHAGQSWCYIETAPNKYERRAITLDLPLDDGYLVKSGLTAGMRVVTRGASLLLSREAGPSEDDEDDGGAQKPVEPDAEKKAEPAPDKTSDEPRKDNPPAAAVVSAKPDTKAAASTDKDPD